MVYKSLHPCTLDERSFSIGKINIIHGLEAHHQFLQRHSNVSSCTNSIISQKENLPGISLITPSHNNWYNEHLGMIGPTVYSIDRYSCQMCP